MGKVGTGKALVLKAAIDRYLASDEKLTMPPDEFFQPKDFLENDMDVCELVSYEPSKEKFSIYFDFWVNGKKKRGFTLGCMATVDDSGCADVIIDEIRLGSDFIDLGSNNIL